MVKCFSLTAWRDWYLRRSFLAAGLKSTVTSLHDGDTSIHCWIPKIHNPSKPNLLLVHGIGANAKWQWEPIISWVTTLFNVYVPDLLFYGESYTSRPERTEQFQAECVMKTVEAVGGVRFVKMNVVGLSYGGFVGYSIAVQFPEAVEKLVIVGSGVSLDTEVDVEEGLFSAKNIKEAASVLLFQTPDKAKEVMRISFYKPSDLPPSFLVKDFIAEMNVDHYQEKKEFIEALQKDRKFSDLPKITQPTLIIWGESDQIFPLDLGYRLKSHLGEIAELVILKKTGHAVNMEQPKELCKLFKSFLIDQSLAEHENGGNNQKVD